MEGDAVVVVAVEEEAQQQQERRRGAEFGSPEAAGLATNKQHVSLASDSASSSASITSQSSSPQHSEQQHHAGPRLHKQDGHEHRARPHQPWGAKLYFPDLVEGTAVRENTSLSGCVTGTRWEGTRRALSLLALSVGLVCTLLALLADMVAAGWGSFALALPLGVVVAHMDARVVAYRAQCVHTWGRASLHTVASLGLGAVVGPDPRLVSVAFVWVTSIVGLFVDALPPHVGARRVTLLSSLLGLVWCAALFVCLYGGLIPAASGAAISFGPTPGSYPIRVSVQLASFTADMFLVEFVLLFCDAASLWWRHPMAMVHVARPVLLQPQAAEEP